MNDPIKVKKDGPVLEVTIDRPKANAIDSKTSIILGDIFLSFRDDPNLRVAIITGGGEKFFSAGWDLKAVNEGEQADADYGLGGFGGLQELPNMNKPIISDILIGEEVLDQIETKKIETNNTHGTGCTMASALTAGLAKSLGIKEAFQKAHFYVNQAIITSPRFGNGHGPINHSFNIN